MLEKIRAPFKRLINPIAKFLVRIGLTANAVTVIGCTATVIAALVTGFSGQLFWGAVIMTILVLFDALDGSVAALTGGGTTFGAFLDSTLDRIADWAMLMCVILYFLIHTPTGSTWTRIGLAATFVAIMTSFLTPYARARAEAVQMEAKNGLATRADRILIILVALAVVGLGLPYQVLVCAMLLLAVLGFITVIQRIAAVYQQSRQA